MAAGELVQLQYRFFRDGKFGSTIMDERERIAISPNFFLAAILEEGLAENDRSDPAFVDLDSLDSV